MQKVKALNYGAFSLEALFGEQGYSISWDKNMPLTYTEKSFFENYIVSHGKALVELGLSKPAVRSLSYSMRTLYTMAQDALSRLQDTDKTPEQLFHELTEQDDDAKLIPSKTAVLNEILLYLRGLNGSEHIRATIETLQNKIAVYTTVSLGIDENPDDPDHPATLVVRCLQNGIQTPLSTALGSLGDQAEAVTNKLKKLAESGDIMRRIYNDGDIEDSLLLSMDDIGSFLNEIEFYESNGIACYIPAAWKRKNGRFSLFIGPNDLLEQRAGLGADGLIHFNLAIELDGEPLRADDIRFLLEQTDKLFLFHGRWTRINQAELRRVLQMYDSASKRNKSGLSFMEAMRASFMPERYLLQGFTSIDDEPLPINFDSALWTENVLKLAPRPSELSSVDPGDGLHAVLRPYQQEGLNWLYSMYGSGLGACLSDDMGLGKTVEALAFLEKLRVEGKTPSLIVIPASLLNNWQNEIERFTPHMKYRILHSSAGTQSADDDDVDIYITTYSMLQRLPSVFDREWVCAILDEAQAIKNPMTRQSRMVKRLRAKFRLVMTGTPIENSPLDLWSIFQFMNPGFLGDSSSFSEQDHDSREEYLKRIRELVSPFILRRLKTDKSVIADLPQKIEMKHYCKLTEKQALLYRETISRLGETIGTYNGIRRRGFVLNNILRLKQICNHPDQFLKTTGFDVNDSGKCLRLIELCSEIRDMGERVLVFTQFRQMCGPLERILSDVFGRRGYVIHGGVSVQERGEIVERFNDPDADIPFLVLSLRTAGVGLNLTAASHVIHFDRWWNPAVEDQATDRAFRIGQTKNVLVHKLICEGTLEEKIDSLIEGKRSLADSIITTESGITELTDNELLGFLSMDDTE